MSKLDVLSSKRIKAIEKRLEALELRSRQSAAGQPIILDNADFMKLFHISARTSKLWRETLIAHCQIKGKVYYKLSDIQDFLDKHRSEPSNLPLTIKEDL